MRNTPGTNRYATSETAGPQTLPVHQIWFKPVAAACSLFGLDATPDMRKVVRQILYLFGTYTCHVGLYCQSDHLVTGYKDEKFLS